MVNIMVLKGIIVNKRVLVECTTAVCTVCVHSFPIFIFLVVDCGNPLPLEGATVRSHNSTTFGSNVTYVCNNDGMIKQRTCLASGRWSDMGITCGECKKC